MPNLERRTLAEQVYLDLRTAIIEDNFPPEAELQEVALAERYGVSRGPVREALRRLSSDGLVELIPRRGAQLRPIVPHDFLSAYQVREVLEVLAVQLAVPRLSEADCDDLHRRYDELEASARAGDMTAFFQANGAFHSFFVEYSGNGPLQVAYGPVIDLVHRYQRRTLRLRGRLESVLAYHRTIYEAARAGDVDTAAEYTRNHIRLRVGHLGGEDGDKPWSALVGINADESDPDGARSVELGDAGHSE
jgi:DNA-binding GntR family transcriptional regulator